MARFDDETRRRLATGWDPRVCTITEYAHQNGVSERAVRLWRARLRHEGGIELPGGKDDVPLQAIVTALQQRLADLEAGIDAALATVAATRATLEAMEEHCGVPAGTDAPATVVPSSPGPLPPVPMPTQGFGYGWM